MVHKSLSVLIEINQLPFVVEDVEEVVTLLVEMVNLEL